MVGKKAAILLKHHITPIICIGESQKTDSLENIYSVLKSQLSYLKEISKTTTKQSVYIAYEPAWIIGTQTVNLPETIEHVVTWLQTYMKQEFSCLDATIIYGGGINENTIQALRLIKGIEGFLVGYASLDFQIFKKLVLSK